jgi:hypothetical protein
MTGLVIALALIVALAFAGRRAFRRMSVRKRLAALPGMSRETAISVADFDDIELHVARLRCPCGGRYDLKGESSRELDGRRYRTAGIECRFCEERLRIFFDVTGLFH